MKRKHTESACPRHARADCRLVAAAPDMLKACKAALAALEDTEQAHLHEVGPVAEAGALLRSAIKTTIGDGP